MSLSRRLFFNFSYFRKPRWDTGVTPPELFEFIAAHPPGRALDLGCGTGTNAITLAEHGWQVTGIDYALPAIRRAHKKARQAGLQIDFRLGDVTRLADLSSPFDLILDIGCFHNLDSQQKIEYIHNISSFLSPGGTFLLYAFLRQAGAEQRGIDPGDIERLESCLTLASRKDGSERGLRPSSWLTFQNG